jgi:hypothetical protein
MSDVIQTDGRLIGGFGYGRCRPEVRFGNDLNRRRKSRATLPSANRVHDERHRSGRHRVRSLLGGLQAEQYRSDRGGDWLFESGRGARCVTLDETSFSRKSAETLSRYRLSKPIWRRGSQAISATYRESSAGVDGVRRTCPPPRARVAQFNLRTRSPPTIRSGIRSPNLRLPLGCRMRKSAEVLERAGIPKGAKVLDVGCGTGAYDFALGARGPARNLRRCSRAARPYAATTPRRPFPARSPRVPVTRGCRLHRTCRSPSGPGRRAPSDQRDAETADPSTANR